LGEKHGKSKKGARFNRKAIVKDARLRANNPQRAWVLNPHVAKVDSGRVTVTVTGRVKDVKKFWHWRR